MPKQSLFGVNLFTFLEKFITHFSQFFMPLFLLELGFNGWQMGLLMSLSVITGLLFTFPIGKKTDEIAAKSVAAIGTLAIGIHFVGIAVTSSFMLLALLFFLGGLGKHMASTSLKAMVFKVAGNKKNGTQLGIHKFWETFAAACGFIAGGWLLTYFSFSYVFKMGGVALLVIGLATFFLRDTKTTVTTFSEYKQDYFRKEVLIYSLILFLYTLHWGAELTSYTPFLEQTFGLSRFWIGVYMAIPVVVLALFSLGMGMKIDDNWSAKKALYVGLLLAGVGHITMTIPDITVSFISRIIHEMGDGIVLLVILVDISRLFPIKRIGGNNGIMTTVMLLGAFAGSLVFGPLGYTYGYGWSLAISGVLTLVALGVAVLYRNHLKD